MITKFDSLFAGHIDLENVGYGGVPVNDRRFSNSQLVTAFDKMEAIAQTMDSSGYDTFWVAEHHFQPEGYECIPNVVMAALHLAHKTKNIHLGCGFNVVPMWHPLRLAEDFATVDYLTGGRVKFGVGRGYHSREVESFGAPLFDQEANRSLFEEQVEIIFKSFDSESFSHKGNFYNIPPNIPYRGYDLEEITLVPRPVNPVECWQPIQSGSRRALDFMAKYGIKGIIGGGSADGGAMDNIMIAYKEANERAGRQLELGENLSIGIHVYLADSREQGIKEAAHLFEENLKIFAPLRLVRALSEEQIEIMADPQKAPNADLPRIEGAVNGGGFLTGPPELIIEQIQELEAHYPGLDRINVAQPVGTPQKIITEQLKWFSEGVMPAFTSRSKAQMPAE